MGSRDRSPVLCQYRAVSSVGRQPFPLLNVMPPVLRDVVLDFLWDPKLLWSLQQHHDRRRSHTT
jgi:hypothetical protein